MYEDSSSNTSKSNSLPNHTGMNDISLLSNDVFGFNTMLTKQKAEKIIKKNKPQEKVVKFDLGSDDGGTPLAVNNPFSTAAPTTNQKRRKTLQTKAGGDDIFEFTDYKPQSARRSVANPYLTAPDDFMAFTPRPEQEQV